MTLESNPKALDPKTTYNPMTLDSKTMSKRSRIRRWHLIVIICIGYQWITGSGTSPMRQRQTIPFRIGVNTTCPPCSDNVNTTQLRSQLDPYRGSILCLHHLPNISVPLCRFCRIHDTYYMSNPRITKWDGFQHPVSEMSVSE